MKRMLRNGSGMETQTHRRLAGLTLAAAFSTIVTTSCGPLPPLANDPESLRREARLGLQRKDFTNAIAALDRLEAVGAISTAERMMRADAWIGLGAIDRALQELAGIGDDDPEAAKIRAAEGRLQLWHQHRAREAEQSLRRAVALDPKAVAPLRDLAKLFDLQGRIAERHETYRQLSTLTPLTDEELLLWCRLRRPDGETREVVTLLEWFLNADPSDRSSRLALADQYERLGRLEEAEALLTSVPDSDPEAQAIRARIAIERGDEELTRRLLAGVVHPGERGVGELLRLQGQQALLCGEPRRAAECYRMANLAEPGNRQTLLGLGQALELLGNSADAERWLRAAEALDEVEALVQAAVTQRTARDPSFLKRLAGALEAADKLHEAKAWYRKALAADPLDPSIQKALYRLESRLVADQTTGPP